MNRVALRSSLTAFVLSRGLITLVGVLAFLVLPLSGDNIEKFDDSILTQPFHGPLRALFTPWARWDSVWYLQIARDGYFGNDYQSAFFPLYPLSTRILASFLGGFHATPAALLIAALVISSACFFTALYLLHRLVELELWQHLAGPTLLLVAFFPMAFFFSAAYSESLFLCTSIAAFYFARRGRWAWAGVFGALAAGTRSAGVLLLVPLAVLYLWGPRAGGDRRPWHEQPGGLLGRWRKLKPRFALKADALWLLLVPGGLGAYMLYLGLEFGEPLRFIHVQSFWMRELLSPMGGIYEGASAAFQGARQLLHGSRQPVYWTSAAGDPFSVAAQNLELFAFLALSLIALVGTFRKLPFAYGSYAASALALPLLYPVKTIPLMSLPRFIAVLFPLFIWLALTVEKRGWIGRTVAVFAVFLVFYTTQWSTWHWVS